MSTRFLDDEARRALDEAIARIERESAIEVVVALRRTSARYLHVNVLVGALVAFAGLAAMLYASYPFSFMAILVDPFLVGLVAGGLVEWLPAVKRVLTPRRIRDRSVHRAARATFVERGVHNTADRSGLLVYISWLEQEVALVPDSGLVAAFTPEAIAAAEATLDRAMPAGGAAVARALPSWRPGSPARCRDAPMIGTSCPIASSTSSRAGGGAVTRDRRVRWLAALVLAVLVGEAIARPGGGDSYSGGGGHGGGGGNGDGFAILELLYWLVRLAIEVPQIGVPLIILVVGYLIYQKYKQHQNKDWDSGPPVALERAVRVQPDALDPAFSHVLFEDFVFRLVSTAHRARHAEAALATVAPYVSQAAREALASREPVGAPVESVVVGALRTVGIDHADGRVRIAVELELNVTTAAHTYYSVETWTFGRLEGRESKPPGATRGFPCPNCGAPWQAPSTGTQQCASCGEVVDNGRFDWTVEHVALRSIDERPPTLTEEVPERGTDLPTYRQPGAERALLALEADDPAITDALLLERLAMIYDQLNHAWSAGDLRPIRGLVSAGLYDYLSYWVEAYRRQGLRNKLENMRITHREIAKVTRDRYYDAITVRIWGTGKDTVVRADSGEHVRGARLRERKYSEYWTMIRSASRKGPPVTQPVCSNCGAPLQITMAGVCEYCGAYLVAGEFDWVLSKVEQDDSYRG